MVRRLIEDLESRRLLSAAVTGLEAMPDALGVDATGTAYFHGTQGSDTAKVKITKNKIVAKLNNGPWESIRFVEDGRQPIQVFVIDLHDGDDTLVFTAQGNRHHQPITIHGGSGNDDFELKSGQSLTVYAGGGDDDVDCNSPKAFAPRGHEPNMVLHGEEGNDRIHGSRGLDTIYLGPGNDLSVTGYDSDVVIGGGGFDQFFHDEPEHGFGALIGDGDDVVLVRGPGSVESNVRLTGIVLTRPAPKDILDFGL